VGSLLAVFSDKDPTPAASTIHARYRDVEEFRSLAGSMPHDTKKFTTTTALPRLQTPGKRPARCEQQAD